MKYFIFYVTAGIFLNTLIGKGADFTQQAYFLGSSGKNGFFSFFSQLMPSTKGRFLYILKGGPGTGKSSFMKKIADEMEKKDISCERIYCSSDPHSLDAVIFPSLRVGIVDGTAPHTTDPDYPGACAEIINLGQFWNKDALRGKSEKIIELTDKNAECHRRSRRFIDSAFSVYSDGERICSDCLDNAHVSRYAARLANRYLKRPSAKIGLESTRLFEAITPEGCYFMNETAKSLCDIRILFEDDFGVAAEKLIRELRTYALASGYSVISSPFIGDGKSIRHIIIKELSLGFFTADKLFPLEIEPTKTISLRRFYSVESIAAYRARLNFSKKASKELMNEAVSSLAAAKTVHDELEELYVSEMDFEAVERLRCELFERIWASEWWSEE